MDRTEALALLQQYNKEPFHIQHALTVEAVMGYFAEKLGYGNEKAFWETVGLLHDLDFCMILILNSIRKSTASRKWRLCRSWDWIPG